MKPIQEAIGRSAYPGRCILIGKSQDGRHAVIAYSIMGRSENSRNRVFVAMGDGLRTKAHDESKLTDPSLVIYAPVRVLGDTTIVTNGAQTDTIYETMAAGGTFEEALCQHTYEPDGPNWTPRISGIVTLKDGNFAYRMSILKRGPGHGDGCLRFFYGYEKPMAGVGHFLHTYASDGDPLPSFVGEPEPVALSGDIDTLAAALWQGLNTDNKVALFIRYIDITSGQAESRITSKLS